MRLFDIANSKEFRNLDISFYVESELADILVDDILESDEAFFEEHDLEYIDDCIQYEDIVFVSRNVYDDGTREWFIEPLYHTDDCVQYDNESDVIFIQDEILDCIDIDKLHGKIASLKETEDLLDIYDDSLSDILVNKYEDEEEICECEYCQGFDDGYSEGYANALRMMRDAINEILEEYN